MVNKDTSKTNAGYATTAAGYAVVALITEMHVCPGRGSATIAAETLTTPGNAAPDGGN